MLDMGAIAEHQQIELRRLKGAKTRLLQALRFQNSRRIRVYAVPHVRPCIPLSLRVFLRHGMNTKLHVPAN